MSEKAKPSMHICSTWRLMDAPLSHVQRPSLIGLLARQRGAHRYLIRRRSGQQLSHPDGRPPGCVRSSQPLSVRARCDTKLTRNNEDEKANPGDLSSGESHNSKTEDAGQERDYKKY